MSLRSLLFVLLSCCSLFVVAQPRESVEGVHFVALPKAVPTETDADKIEVREIFWYGCQECSTLEPMMTEWRNAVAGDRVFARMPAVWNELMSLHARIYYTGKELNLEDRIHKAAFRAIHEQQNPLRNVDQVRDFFAANGVAADKFDAAWNAETVTNAVQQATLRTADYGVDKLPAVIMNGRYRITHNAAVFNHIELNIAINNVIRKLRDERRTDF